MFIVEDHCFEDFLYAASIRSICTNHVKQNAIKFNSKIAIKEAYLETKFLKVMDESVLVKVRFPRYIPHFHKRSASIVELVQVHKDRQLYLLEVLK